MIIGWERHRIFRNIKHTDRLYISDETCEYVQMGKIMLIPDIKEIKQIKKRKVKKVCKATCLDGKPCIHKPQSGLEFCKRHLKIYEP